MGKSNKRSECKNVNESFLSTARARGETTRTMSVSASQLFAAFEDGDSWPEWVPVIRRVQWTSPKPYGVGTTRTVTLLGGIELDERFWAWEQNRHMGFVVTASSSGMTRALIESYEVTPIDARSCTLRWRMAMELSSPLSFVAPYMKSSLGPALNSLLAKLEKVASRYPSTTV